MKKHLPLFSAFFVLALLTGCTSTSLAPSTDITQLQGEYRTNGAIDVSCVAISNPDEMPRLSVTRKADGTYTLARTDFFPTKRITELTQVTVQSKPDTLMIFRNNQRIGSLYLGTWRDYSGKKVREVKSSMLLVSLNDTASETFFFFLGFRQ